MHGLKHVIEEMWANSTNVKLFVKLPSFVHSENVMFSVAHSKTQKDQTKKLLI